MGRFLSSAFRFQIIEQIKISSERQGDRWRVSRPWREIQILRFLQMKYKKEDLLKLCTTAISVFKSESTLCEISPPLTIIGDIHGQFRTLLRILSCQNDKKEFLEGKKKPAFAAKRLGTRDNR